MKYLNLLFIVLLASTILSCDQEASDNSATNAPAETFNAAGYSISDLSQSALKKAVKKDANGAVIEDGYLLDNEKTGTWTTYYEDGKSVKSITNYINGQPHGVHLEFSNRNQINIEAYYDQGVLNGPWKKIRTGTIYEKEAFYKNGQLDQYYREYHRNGKLMKEVQYKDGKMHGSFKQYDDQEKLLMDYQYENGEKVSGGVVQ